MKCRVCGSKAIINLKRHNTSFCHNHFNEFFIKQVEKAIKKYSMFSREEEILVCVSGGKDSLALWYALNKMGYKTKGLYIHLGIGDYSNESLQKVEKFAEKNNLPFIVKKLGIGRTISELSKKSGRKKCSVCGIVKRYFFNKIPHEQNIDVVATGHNMD
ncbi:MAG: ATP-binding protein, partial [Deferribacterota bacterium]|nr:ATP-binding protein [Deferribacterota bacterium]